MTDRTSQSTYKRTRISHPNEEQLLELGDERGGFINAALNSGGHHSIKDI